MSNSTPKKKVKIPRQRMPIQVPRLRVRNFKEVNLGFDIEIAQKEAERCLQCAKPLCVEGCPVNINIPEFIKLIKDGDIQEAIRSIKEYNILPAICGRVCQQENQCEAKCVMRKRFDSVAIGSLERFLADWERANQLKECPDCEVPNNIKVAIIGSGPSGLTCAADMARFGYDVTIFEAFHKGGGVLIYGIPEFRLPKEIVEDEIETLKMLGVKIEYNMIIGKILTIDDLKSMGFKTIFIGIGAGSPRFLGIPGENLKGIVSANEYLTRTNLMKAYDFPKFKTPIVKGKNVVVIGGGNTAMDSARTALRLGANTVTIVYRRAMEQLPARREEVHHGEEEGIIFKLLTNPLRFIGDEQGNVKELEVIEMKLGDLDESGRASPIPIENSEFIIKADLVIVGIGNNANPLLTSTYPALNLNKRGNIIVDETGKTNVEGIFAGGDIVTGAATVISAMGAGRRAAKTMNQYLKSNVF
ncbi:MAG: NADPH-dependent glutamate synthase [Candidatus Lokiarchaeota archaeon]|nr:NADPH-dependent glutamate synthase [Candidatus Lokiarchaeota archaeon]